MVIPIISPDQKITLNNFPGYLSGNGEQLEVELGQIIYFMVGNQQHSATVKEIGADYVIVTLASTPKDVRLQLGQAGEFDVTEDGIDDIKMTLNSLAGRIATITFAQVYQTNMPTVETPVKKANNYLMWLLIGSGILFLIFLLLIGKYATDDKHK